MRCRDCKYVANIGNTEETGIALCTYNPYYTPTEVDGECRILPEAKELTCGDCAALGEDYACAGCRADDSAYINGHLCHGFIDKKIDELWPMMLFWKQHGLYDRGKVIEALDEYEKAYDELANAFKQE